MKGRVISKLVVIYFRVTKINPNLLKTSNAYVKKEKCTPNKS
jgi:hypothetical protein